MNPKYALTIAVALVLGFACALQAEDTADAREELATAVPEAIRLLKSKQYEEFVESFIAPDDLKNITAKRSVEEFARQFAETHAASLLEVLQGIEGQRPKLDPDGKTATFIHGIKDAPRETITFARIGKYWYIQN